MEFPGVGDSSADPAGPRVFGSGDQAPCVTRKWPSPRWGPEACLEIRLSPRRITSLSFVTAQSKCSPVTPTLPGSCRGEANPLHGFRCYPLTPTCSFTRPQTSWSPRNQHRWPCGRIRKILSCSTDVRVPRCRGTRGHVLPDCCGPCTGNKRLFCGLFWSPVSGSFVFGWRCHC